MLTQIHKFGDVFVKREDLACWTSPDYPSGSKVRQYMAMAEIHKPYRQDGAFEQGYHPYPMPPCLVGCSADSAMQIYVAAAAKQLMTKGIIYTAKRKVQSDATLYALRMGAEVNEFDQNSIQLRYLSQIRKAARQRAIDEKMVVQWNRNKAIEDTIAQCHDIPKDVKRIIVPTGSGLTAAGVLIGCPSHEVVAVCVSPMASHASIMRLARTIAPVISGSRLTFIPPSVQYSKPVVAQLPDGTPLDPFYAAKAWAYMQPGDILWPPGLRPVISMPEICREQFKNWKGPK